ncbi:VWA domain-containing protein [Streptomyces polygonati]|uniref:VWA domain-containing protein n=1 Tax=Streptomyces polygonati TaxID=1617087 RepID=A0ABV8HM41_9ACTN
MVRLVNASAVGLSFDVEVDAPWDLAFDDTRADALVTISARSAAEAAPRTGVAEILIMDRSLSMAGRGKLAEAKRAMCAAIDTLHDGAYLGVIAGNHRAEVVYPPGGGLARVDDETRAAARRQVADQLPEGGTAIGSWLTCAERLFSSAAPGGTVRHAVLYTDGRDEHETGEQLTAALTACTDRFVCDARGLGDDWDYAELLRITEALHGGAEAVIDVADLTGDFTRLMRKAHGLVVPRVYLTLRLNDRFRVGFVRQTRPTEADLTAQQQPRGGEIHVPLGAWPPEVRQYQLSLSFDADALPVDEDLRAARVGLHAETPGGSREPCAETRAMVVRRSGTPGLATVRPASLTRVENERELGMAMRACADAQRGGDPATANRELRVALELAERLGDAVRLRLLRRVSAPGRDGVPALRPDVTRGEMQQLGLDSAKTGTAPADLIDPAPPADRTRVCRHCGATTSARVLRHCESCGRPFDDEVADSP